MNIRKSSSLGLDRADALVARGGTRARFESDRALGVTVMTSFAFWLCVLFYSIQGLLPFHPATLPFRQELATHFWLPQGWKFFTRNPREDWTLIYRQSNGHWENASLGPNFNQANWFGMRRLVRAQGIELGTLLYQIHKEAWKPCKRRSTECLDSLPSAGTTVNRTPSPSLCGVIGIAMQEQLPWAWSGAEDRITMPSRVVKVTVRC